MLFGTKSLIACANLKASMLCRNRKRFFLHIYPPITRKRSMRYRPRSSLRSFQSSVYHTKIGKSREVSFPKAQLVNLPACSPHNPFDTKRQAANASFKVIGLTRLGMKPKSTAPEADALTTRQSELLIQLFSYLYDFSSFKSCFTGPWYNQPNPAAKH